MKSHFLQLFDYDAWANAKVAECILEKPIDNQKIILLFSHLLAAQKTWLNRCLGKETPIKLWESDENWNNLRLRNQREWKDYIQSLNYNDFEQILSYQTSTGIPFKTALKDIFTHLINHGTYHRGQIIQLLKEERDSVPATDFIFWIR